jgi:hypothetical protein
VPELRDTDSVLTGVIVATGAIVLTMVVIISFRGSVSPWMIVEGIAVGAVASMLWLLGHVFPYAAHLGGREPADFSGEWGWTHLPAILLVFGLIGAGIGLTVGGLGMIVKVVGTRARQASP